MAGWLGIVLAVAGVALAVLIGWVVMGRRNRGSDPDPVGAAPSADPGAVAQPATGTTDEVAADPAPAPVTTEPVAGTEPAAAAEPAPRTDPAEAKSASAPPQEPAAAASEPAAAELSTPELSAAESAAADSAPVAGTAATPASDDSGPADDFRRIQGIGPKVATALQAAGIRTYQQLADADEETLRAALKASGVRGSASLPSWPERARALAGGEVVGR